MVKKEAQNVLFDAGIAIGQGFSTLSPSQLTAIQNEASAAYLRKHGRPMGANSTSFIQKRYDLLQRRARRSALTLAATPAQPRQP